jgi:glucosamine--fructose-6-phosphate aminotransferase (isomerizing)
MCGIVGYVGKREANSILLDGLEKLEYRGYDSAGVAVFDGSKILVQKSQGRLAVLSEKLKASPLRGRIGIGHTRWATHGRPSDQNAHPHTDGHGKFAVVHNGIIENYRLLKSELEAAGHVFVSDTDTEIVAHLLSQLYNGDFVDTVRRAVEKMEGAYALAILCEDCPNQLVAVRLSSPLVVGLGEQENFIGSDIPALLSYTRDVYFLEDGEIAVISADSVQILDARSGAAVVKETYRVEWDMMRAEKSGYDHFMMKEIDEQPKAFRDTMSGRIKADGAIDLGEITLSPEYLRQLDKIYIVACGTAYHAGLVGKTAIETLARIPVEVEVASEFRYRNPIMTERTLVIVVSQSGETADTLAALRESRRLGTKVLAISNVVGSSVAREADEVLFTWAGPEIAVASTKAYTSQLIVFFLLAAYLGQQRGLLSHEEEARYTAAMQRLPKQVEEILAQTDVIKKCAGMIKEHKSLFFIGRGVDYAVALEGSLKLKEISYIHSEAYAAGELKHGTLALIEEGVPVIALATQPQLYEKMVSNIQEVKARDAFILSIGLKSSDALELVSDHTVLLPDTLPLLMPALAVVPLQLLAYYTAVALGHDVDKPRNLAKSVTVE